MDTGKDRLALRVALVIVLVLIGAGCVRAQRPAATEAAWLAGTWQGEMWETPAFYLQGFRRLTVTITADGAWTATTSDGRSGSGSAMMRGAWVVLRGRLGPDSLVHYTLKQRDQRQMWGMVVTTFGTRTAPVLFGLERVK